jgi:hypothetical protein
VGYKPGLVLLENIDVHQSRLHSEVTARRIH